MLAVTQKIKTWYDLISVNYISMNVNYISMNVNYISMNVNYISMNVNYISIYPCISGQLRRSNVPIHPVPSGLQMCLNLNKIMHPR